MLLPAAAWAEQEPSDETDELTAYILSRIDVSEWDAFFRAQGGAAAGLPLPSELLTALVRRDATAGADGWEARIFSLWKQQLPGATALLLALVGLAVLGGTAGQLLPDTGGMGNTVLLVLRAAAGALILSAVIRQTAACREALYTLCTLGELLLPVLLGLLGLFGLPGAAGVLQACSALLGGGIQKVLAGAVLPLGIIGGVTGVIDALGERGEGLSGLFFGACKWLIGVITTGFALFASVRGLVASAQDGLLLRTTRLAAGSLPAMGSLVSGSLDAVFSLLTVVKNGVGLTGILLALAVLLRPAAALLMYLFALQLAAYLCEPLGAKKLSAVIKSAARMLGILLSALVAAAAMLAVTLAAGLTIGKGV